MSRQFQKPISPLPRTIKVLSRPMVGRLSVLLALGPLFLAAACGTTDNAAPKSVSQGTASQTPPPVMKTQTETPIVVAPLPDTVIPAQPTPVRAPQIAPVTPPVTAVVARESAPKPPPSPKRLLGMHGAAVAGVLGPAKFVRRDGDAEIWQYRNDHCVLDVFLYGPGPLSVAHVDLRKRRRGTQEKNACYAELAQGAATGS
jgi:hypothetical protein